MTNQLLRIKINKKYILIIINKKMNLMKMI